MLRSLCLFPVTLGVPLCSSSSFHLVALPGPFSRKSSPKPRGLVSLQSVGAKFGETLRSSLQNQGPTGCGQTPLQVRPGHCPQQTRRTS